MDEQQLADQLSALDRWLRRFPEGSKCADCGEGNRLVLCRHRERIVCHGCRLVRQGRSPVEEHHLGGVPGSATVPLPANLHRLLTVLQQTLWRSWLEPGSNAAQLFDMILLRVLGPSFGVEV
jgi:hypothetical protein